VYLIALSGGKTAERNNVAAQLLEAGKGRLTLCAQADLASLRGHLREVQLVGSQAIARARLLSQSLGGLQGPDMQGRGFIVAHCLTAEEAQVVRELDGAVWHVYSRPCSRVAIRKGDAIINGDGGGSFRHVREPIEALSDYLLASRGQSREVR
jgi:hypothetical protein